MKTLERIFKAGPVVGATAFAVAGLLSGAQAQGQSVYESGFEPPEYSPGLLVSDPDWSFDATALNVEVLDTDYAEGLQSLSLTGDSPFDFIGDPSAAAAQVLWLDFSLKPVFLDWADLPLAFAADRTAVTGFVKVDAAGEIYAVNGDGQGSGEWLATGHTATLEGNRSQDWIRLTYRLDYGARRWDLFVDGEMVAVDLGFLSPDATGFEVFTFRGDESESSGLDAFSAGEDNPLFTDADNDGIDDAYELAQGMNTGANDRDADRDFDTLSNLQEYLDGLAAGNADSDGDGVHDGAEVASGADPALADGYSLSSLPLTEDFEAAAAGDFGGAGWTIAGAVPQVQSEEVAAGSQALALSADSVLHNAIDGSDESVVWVDVYIRPQGLATAPSVDADAAHAYYFNDAGRAVALDGTGNGSGLWQLLDVATSGDWRRVTTKLDYASQTYDLYVDGARVASGLGFARVQPYLGGLGFAGTQVAHLDDLSVSGAEPAGLDDDRDGWDNATEAAAGTDSEVFDTDADGLADSLEGVWSRDPLTADTALATLTESEPGSGVFEWSTSFAAGEGYAEAALDGQLGWSASGDVLVTAEQVDVTDSVSEDASFERLAGIGETRRIWISFRAKLVVGALPYVPALTESVVAIWGAPSSDTISVWDAAAGQWLEFEANADVTGWNDYTLYFDYVEGTWLITQNGVLLASGLRFKDEDLIVFSRFKALQGSIPGEDPQGERSVASFDDFTFSNTEPEGLDFDGDGLMNNIERQLGSDLFSRDTDGDGFEDLLEYENGFDLLADDRQGDLDGDGLLNWQEIEWGFDPQLADVGDGTEGIVRRDVWTGIGGDSVAQLTDNVNFPLNPSKRMWSNDLDFPQSENFGDNYGQRVYGLIVAPETGEYTFWIAGDDFCELWLSTDESASNRERIAYLYGWTNYQNWNASLTQQSASVHLVAGQAYYFELLHKEKSGGDHVSVAWQYGGEPRQIIAGQHLGANTPEANDQDQDGLPDDWESANGLDPEKGYGVNGYAADYDSDGLRNYEEYRAGTSPSSTDSDGDGYDDYTEVKELYSDPTVQDLSGEPVVVATVDGASFSSSRGSWGTEGTEVYSIDSTGSIRYHLNFAEAGAYRIVVALTEQNAYKSGTSTFELRGNLDGISCGLKSASVAYGETAEVYYDLPYLPAGTHEFGLDWLNGFGDSFLRIRSLRLEMIAGADLDENGVADWIEARAAEHGSEAELPLVIYASPFCFEGTSFAPAAVSIHSHPLSDSSLLREETVRQALYNSYYADIALSPEEDCVVLVDDQSGLRSSQHALTWAAYNAYEHDFIHIRLNDSLLLAAFDPALAETRPVEIVLDAPDGTTETYQLAAGARLQTLFEQAGDWALAATILPLADEEPIVLESEVRVSGAALQPAPIIFDNTPRPWTPSISDGEVELEADTGLLVYEANPGAMPRTFEINSGQGGGQILARLPDGPILSATPVKAIRNYSFSETRNQIVETFPDGTVMVSAYIILNEVPEDLSVVIQVFKSGVTFDDGTHWRTVTAEDFDEQGRYQFFMLRSPGVVGGNCHNYWFKQDGLVIGGS